MSRIHMISNRIAIGVANLYRLVPNLGTAPTYESCDEYSTSVQPVRTTRNRWSRMDLASAIGQDPHVTDPAVQVWPPRSGLLYPCPPAQRTSCCQSRA